MNFGETLKKLRIKENETLCKLSMKTKIDLTVLVVSDKAVSEYGLNNITSKAINFVSKQLTFYASDSEARNED